MHADLVGDIAQHHRLHRFVTLLQEIGLPLHYACRNLEQGLVSDLQAANKPACFLQLGAQHRVIATAAQQFCVLLIDGQLRHAGGTDFDLPAIIHLAHEHVGNDVLGSSGADDLSGTWITATNQGQRVVQGLFRCSQTTPQLAVLSRGNEVEVLVGKVHGELQAGRRLVELLQLQRNAFRQ